MKTFLGFMTGLLSGTVIGIVFIAWVGVVSPEYREVLEKVAIE